MGLDHASLTSLAALGDATRRRMFELIRHERRPVTREEVADSLGISPRAGKPWAAPDTNARVPGASVSSAG